jgi:uncharacterized protein
MGHRDSSAQLGGHSRFFGAHAGTAEGASARELAARVGGETGRINSRGKSAAAWVLLLFLRFYITFLSPFFGGACKFHPSCSNYAREAVALHGARRGLALACRRLLRCRPFTKGGFDPVPEPSSALNGQEHAQ